MAKLSYHVPVMLEECIDFLKIDPNGVYVDCTYGGGSHSEAILKKLSKNGKLFAFDQDPDAEANVVQDERLVFIDGNFRHLKKLLKIHGVKEVDGILADLGVSSHQFDSAKRGFSYGSNEFLDMRMEPDVKLTAADILNKYRSEELVRVFSNYGEVRNSKTLAEAIVSFRAARRFKVVPDLNSVLDAVMLGDRFKYMAQVFQALRIEVNDELKALKDLLVQGGEVLKTNGRFVVMSYHSLEDKLVKNYFKTGNTEGEHEKDFYGNISKNFKLITKKPIVASDDEKKLNPRSTSSRLRVAEKI